jgi:hypothetical protein
LWSYIVRLLVIDSLAELRRRATAWDDLWWRSPSATPTHRAELVAQWVEQFAAGKPFAALCVEDEGQMIAALPLTTQHPLKWIGTPAANCWSDSGELLIDGESDARRAVEMLVAGLRRTPWSLLLVDGINLAHPGWKLLGEVLAERRVPTAMQHKHRAGVIDVIHDWDAYVAALSSSTRRMLKKLRAKAEQSGPLEVRAITELHRDAFKHDFRLACELEDGGWKGRAGTSILRSPGMFEFFLRQAEQLLAWNQLELYFLWHRERAIAFDYCCYAKGVIGSHKIGYDEEFRELGPSQLLRFLQLEQWQHDSQRKVVDTLGILDEAKSKWCTRTYEVSRLTFSTGGPIGSLGMFAYRNLKPLAVRLRGRRDVEDESCKWEASAARCLTEHSPMATEEIIGV